MGGISRGKPRKPRSSVGSAAPQDPAIPPAPPQGADRGLSTIKTEAELLAAAEASTPTLPEAEEDKGMQAGNSVDEGQGEAGGPGLPTAEIPLPPAESTAGAPPISPDLFAEPGPTAGMEGPSAPVQKDALPPDSQMVQLLVSDALLHSLWQRADQARNDVTQKIQTLEIARSLLDQIKYARNYLMAGRGYYEEAERHVNEVDYRVFQTEQSKRYSRVVGIPLFIYEILWTVTLALLFYLNNRAIFSQSQTDLQYVIASMISGGIGGVMGAWFALVKHMAQDQDFDKQHSVWYLNSPLMGLGIGAFVYMVMRAGLISLTGSTSQTIASPYIIYVLAWLGGYQHNVFTVLVKRVIKVFVEPSTSAEESKPVSKEPAAPQQPAPPTAPAIPEAPQEGSSHQN